MSIFKSLFRTPPPTAVPPTGRVDHELSLARVDKRPHEDEFETEQRPLEWNLIYRLISYTRPYATKRNWLLCTVILRSIQIPALAWVMGMIINGPVLRGDVHGILLGAAGFALLAFLTQLTMHFRQRLALELGEQVVRDLRNEIYQRLMVQQMAYYTRTKLGRIISRLTSDVDALRNGVQNVLFVSIVQGGQMIGAGALMLYYNWRLFSVILFMAPVLWAINRYFRRRISQATRDVQESFSRVTASIAETVKGIRVTQGFVREQVNAGLFRRLISDHAGYNIGLTRNVAMYIPLLDLNSQIFTASLLALGGYGVLHNEWNMPVGDLIVFFFLADHFFSPFIHIGQQFTHALTAMAGAERVFRLLDNPPDWRDDPEATTLPRIRGEVEFEKVEFAYSPGKTVLRDISFTAQTGQTIALVGHTGSGKTTIISLIAKFYLPTAGRITIDGRDLAKATSESLHRQMGLVLQQNFLFSGTVIENIRLGRLEATDQEVHQAIQRLGCEDMFEAMANGLHTAVGERGSGLSVGQQQLVCFARAMLADPRILILDEATSAIDSVTEARLQQALSTLLQGRTSFVVAHRLSTIRRADQILVLDHGRIVERGNHPELLLMNGVYAGLYRQFATT